MMQVKLDFLDCSWSTHRVEVNRSRLLGAREQTIGVDSPDYRYKGTTRSPITNSSTVTNEDLEWSKLQQ